MLRMCCITITSFWITVWSWVVVVIVGDSYTHVLTYSLIATQLTLKSIPYVCRIVHGIKQYTLHTKTRRHNDDYRLCQQQLHYYFSKQYSLILSVCFSNKSCLWNIFCWCIPRDRLDFLRNIVLNSSSVVGMHSDFVSTLLDSNQLNSLILAQLISTKLINIIYESYSIPNKSNLRLTHWA